MSGDTLHEAIEALVVGDEDFAELERTREVFCPFEAIGMVRQEIRHARFLGHCLDPKRPHGFGTAVLEALLRTAAAAERDTDGGMGSAPSPLDIHLMDLSEAEVKVEYRRIDLIAVVHAERLVITAELKIDASEHSGQLGRYRRIVEEQWPVAAGWRHLLLFLTLQGDMPSEDGASWLPVRMDEFARELDLVAARRAGDPGAPLLTAYLAMLRRHHLMDEALERLAERLWARHREALEFLADRRPDNSTNVLASLHERRFELARDISAAAGIEVVPDDGTRSMLRFAVPAWDNAPGMRSAIGWTSSSRLLLMEVQASGDKRACRVRMVIGPGRPEDRERLYAALDDAMPNLTRRKQITGRWTRLGTETLARDLLDPDLDPDEAAGRIAQGLQRYAAQRLPEFDAALQRLAEPKLTPAA